MAETNNHSLITYFRNIYRLDIPEKLTPNGTSLLFAILYKLNEHQFPDKISISNTELSSLTGCDKATIWRIRPILLEYRYNGIENNWLIKYFSAGKKHAGFYQLNYILLNRLQIAINNENSLTESENKLQNAIQNKRKNENISANRLQIAMDHREDLKREDNSSYTNSNITCNKEATNQKEKNNFSKLNEEERKKQFEANYFRGVFETDDEEIKKGMINLMESDERERYNQFLKESGNEE